ncbi:MAG: hypothetical protein DBY08_03610 [Clostridiales bacterium]|nr:S24 family peptidase [Bacillota bacterium]MEE0517861.1 S24 family peptidase [Anaerovoracaceae bacterium]PWL93998.1 MAG: hypothetical protein DBY08_03610 [Clostridiales bacterium]
MKRAFAVLTAALIGFCTAALLHCSFMVVEAAGSSMLPAIEPGQKTVVFRLTDADDIREGDIIAYRRPYYAVDGENGVLLRRVAEVSKDRFILSCDSDMTYEQKTEVLKRDIIGKVIMF